MHIPCSNLVMHDLMLINLRKKNNQTQKNEIQFVAGSESLSTLGITHVFSCINISGSQGSCLSTRPRDQASVNAMKQTCVIVILAYFTLYSNPIRTENAAKTLNCLFSCTDFL